MKYIKTFEGKNTMYWYGKALAKINTMEKFEKMLAHILSADIEDFRMIEFNTTCNFFIYTSKSEKQRNFKTWGEVPLHRVEELTKLGTEIEDIDKWLEEWEFRKEAEKYNL